LEAIAIVLVLFSSCSLYDRKKSVLITDRDFVENYREFSPDSSMVLINYNLDLGGLGYDQAVTAILKASDTTKDLMPFSLPNMLIDTKWIDNKTIAAKINIIPSLRAGNKLKINDTEINDVRIKVSAFDYIEPNYHLQIEHKETSPDGKYELVAYRYLKDNSNLNFIHISVIPKNGKIPRYGNYFIADKTSDYILDGTWAEDNTLIFYSNAQYLDFIQYYFVDSREKIKCKIVENNQKYKDKYRWINDRRF